MDKIERYKKDGRQIAGKVYLIDDNTICEICGKRKASDHHHIDGDTHNNERENVKKVCRSCHLKEDHALGNQANQTKLSQEQIDFIRAIPKRTPNLIQQRYANDFCISLTYLKKIKMGIKTPIPRPKQYTEPTIPTDWQARPTGKPRALSIKQVREILSYKPMLGQKNAEKLSKKFNVCYSIIFKAFGRQGCYSDSIYD